MLKKEFEIALRRKLKNLGKNSPVFFRTFYDFKNNLINVKTGDATYKFTLDRSVAPGDNVRNVYLTLFEKEYPRMEALDGTVYVLDKVNLAHNLILLKRLNDPASEDLHACKMKIPVVVFLRDYCSREFDINPIDRWNIFVSNIGSIYRGDNIYGI